jgi:chromosome segregation ATPase
MTILHYRDIIQKKDMRREMRMTDRELMEAMYQEICGVKSDVQSLKGEMQGMKGDMQSLKGEMQGLKGEMQGMKDDMQSMKEELTVVRNKVTNVELRLENETNHNIQLLAENHIELINKLNDAIRVQDKSLMFEVQISGLKCRMDTLELELKKLRAQTAESAAGA